MKESAGLPGVIFNTGDLSEPSNLRLQAAARQVWTDPNTIIITCMPFFVSKRMELIQDLWDYKSFAGKGGVDMYSFNNSVVGSSCDLHALGSARAFG